MKRPTYTLPSIIKKVFRPGERSLPKEEITRRVEESLLAAGHDLESEDRLEKLLRMEHSPIRIGRTEAIIELTYQPHQLFDMAYRFLRDTHTPKTVEQIVPELRRQTQFSWNQVERLLQLQRDPRFIQYEGDRRWFLSEWKLANDELYAFAQQKGIDQVSARTVHYFMEQEVGLPLRDYVFLPELDDRFLLQGDSLQILIWPKAAAPEQESAAALPTSAETAGFEEADTTDREAALEPNAAAGTRQWNDEPDTQQWSNETLQEADSQESAPSSADNPHEHADLSAREAAAALYTVEHQPTKIEEEPFMNTTQTPSVLTEVTQLLRQAQALLDQRNQQMSQDVIGYFQQSDMQAIETLMKEKHKNEQIALDIEQVLANAERQ